MFETIFLGLHDSAHSVTVTEGLLRMWLVATVGAIPFMIIPTYGTHKVQGADRYTNTTCC